MEYWKQIIIDGIEYPYMVSRAGEVLSVRRNRLLKLNDNNSGITEARLSVDGKVKCLIVRRLVAKAFLPEPGVSPDGSAWVVSNKNNIKNDNRVENLEWRTFKETCDIHFAKEYELINPEGESVTIRNMSKFSLDSDLKNTNMFAMIHRTGVKNQTYKGWSVENSSTTRKGSDYELLSPTGEKVCVNNLSKFCRDNNLNYSLMNKVVKKFRGAKSHKGWKLYDPEVATN